MSLSRPSTPRKHKRSRLDHDQSSLDTFFSKSAKSSASVSTKRRKLAQPAEPIVLSDDDVLPGPSTSVNVSERESVATKPEVIDVDLLDEPVDSPQPADVDVVVEKHIAHAEAVPSASVSSDPPKYPSVSIDPAAYDLDAFPWTSNTPIPYSFLAHTLSTLSDTRSRIAIINALTNTFRTIIQYHPSSMLPSLYLLSNSLSPPYSPLELGLGPSIISKAIMHVSGLTSAALKRLYTRTGDPGDVAFEAKSTVRTLIPHPPVPAVYDALLKIARAKGQGAVKQKQAIVEKLLVAAKGEEIRFLVRTLSQHIRVGAVRTSILTALSRALVLTSPSNLRIPIPDDSPYHASAELVAEIDAVPTASTKNANTAAQEELLDKFGRAEALIRKVFVQHPNYDHIAQAILDAGLDGLADRVPLTVGIPLHPTLGSPMRSLEEVYERLDEQPFVAEFKYDGQRAQIHAWTTEAGKSYVKIFSRHLEDMTDKYPDIVSLAQHILSTETTSFILDAEIVAIDPNDGSLKTFQELSNRPRKDVKLHEIKVSVCVFAFDLMYLNDQVLLEEPFRKRRAILHGQFPPVTPADLGAARLQHVESCGSEEGKETVEEFWLRAVDSRCEGLMIKLLDHGEVIEGANAKGKSRRKPLPATYEPDKRTSAWLKLKKDYVLGLGDSLDLVPVGAWHGNGRKAQWWSPVLLALRDPDTGTLVAMCKCMSGFSDVVYKAMKERYAEDTENCSKQPLWGDVQTGGYRPSVYFRPHEVWEIRGADITVSPVSVAAKGLVSDDRGLSLRFPRFIKTREDKSVEQASTPEFLASIYRDQQGKGRDQAGADDGQLVDVDLSSEAAEESSGDDDGPD
ncbi:hypothetical protein EVG20_g3074 [Dentipellis fragilis]|uniref:DNA ligase n=1 Tax=Dentipellis fragilis TaxID=205917 RepID=A0A4Y9Z570_9AGAM|nr:hypothetical protein EVG20_g3074 [Dentipellis fragilis]